jgi:predicted Zn-dependent peptidase
MEKSGRCTDAALMTELPIVGILTPTTESIEKDIRREKGMSMKSLAIKTAAMIVLALLFCPLILGQENNPLSVQKIMLDNGLTVYLNEDHSRPSVFGCVVVKAGSKYEDPGATGTAHILEHMLFKGTDVIGTTDFQKEKPIIDRIYALYDTLPFAKDETERKVIQSKINEWSIKDAAYAVPNELSALVQSMGGSGLNASTGNDSVSYFNYFPSREIAKWLDLYSQRFIHPVFRLFQSELESIYEEKNRAGDNYRQVVYETVFARLFKNHPYGRNAVGKTEYLKNPSLTKTMEFFTTYYVANNMALVLCGDFDSNKILPMIKAQFGRLPQGVVPPFGEYKEAPFHGREFVEKNVSPLPIGIIAYRTAPLHHPDRSALEVCEYLLTNENWTGMLDVLNSMGKISQQYTDLEFLQDSGSMLIHYSPTLSGTLEDGEKRVLESISRLRRGDFNEDAFQAAIIQLRKRFAMSLEKVSYRNHYLTEAFLSGREWKEVLGYPQQLENLTKADIVKAAATWFPEDYLCFYSRVGTPQKETLEKPDFAPIPPHPNATSKYASYFATIPPETDTPHFIDFQKDIQQVEVKKNVRLYCSPNPLNDFFSLQFRYQAGSRLVPKMPLAINYIIDLGTTRTSSLALRQQMEKLGCVVSFSWTENETIVSLAGAEDNIGKALALLSGFFSEIKPELERLKNKIKYNKYQRDSFEKNDLLTVADALKDYLNYGANAPRLNRLTIDEMEKTGHVALLNEFAAVLGYEVKICYSGKKDAAEVKAVILGNYALKDNPAAAPQAYVPEPADYRENTVLFVDRKDARQSQIYFFIKGNAFTKKDIAPVNAFKSYFYGSLDDNTPGLNSIMFQEIREFRSLAYKVRASIAVPETWDHPIFFWAYLGCQDDKTVEAVKVMTNLLKNMPEKKDKFAIARDNLIKHAQNAKPDFRELTLYVARNLALGYDNDPLAELLPQYRKLELKDVLGFFRNNFGKKPIAVCIVGNKEKIDMNRLKDFGTIIELDQHALFKD